MYLCNGEMSCKRLKYVLSLISRALIVRSIKTPDNVEFQNLPKLPRYL